LRPHLDLYSVAGLGRTLDLLKGSSGPAKGLEVPFQLLRSRLGWKFREREITVVPELDLRPNLYLCREAQGFDPIKLDLPVTGR
jgi:hypothetical protein